MKIQRQKWACFVGAMFLICGCSGVQAADLTLQNGDKITGILPEPQRVYLPAEAAKSFVVDKTISIMIDEGSSDLQSKAAALLQGDFLKAYKIKVACSAVSFKSSGRHLLISKSYSRKEFERLAGLSAKMAGPAKNPEQSYKLLVTAEGILISAPTAEGIFYGVQTLRQLFLVGGKIAAIGISDWPDQKLRASYGTMSHVSMEEYIKTLASLKMNMAIMESPWNPITNWWYSSSAKTAKKADEFFRLCREYNIEPVPLIQGFGWAYGVVGLNPNCAEGIYVRDEAYVLNGDKPVEIKNRNVLRTKSAPIIVTDASKKIIYAENKDYKIIPGVTAPKFAKSNKAWQIVRMENSRIKSGQKILLSYNYMDYCQLQTPYCPNEPETYKIVDRVIKKVIKRYRPKYIHIGHDEVRYINRCSRCKNTGLSKGDIVIKDFKHWYDTIKSTDSSVTVMMWNDLLKENHFDKPVINQLPKDVIICPWQYNDSPQVQKNIRGAIDWFLVKNNRPVFGAAAGYSNENIALWNQECNRHASNANMLGFFFTFWGESTNLWSSLSMAAEYSWSSSKPSRNVFQLYNEADIICRKYGLGVGLDPQSQKAVIRKRLGFTMLAGENVQKQASEFKKQLAKVRNKLKPYYLSNFSNSKYVESINSPRLLGRLDGIGRLYGQMAAQIAKDDKTASKVLKAKPRYLCSKKSQAKMSWEEEGFWQGVPVADKFIVREAGKLKLSQWATTAQVVYDDGNIYIRMACPFPDVTKLEYNMNKTSESATPIWENDCVQVFFRPSKVSRTQKAEFYQVIVNVGERVMTLVHNGSKKPVKVNVKCEIGDKTWTCIMAVPLEWFGVAADDLKGWGINFARTQLYPNVEYSSWSILPPGTMLWFLQPDYFGELIFEK